MTKAKTLRYRGCKNRRARKIVKLRISQWKRRHGIQAHEKLEPMDWLRAAYGGVFRPMRRRPSPLLRLIPKIGADSEAA